MRQIAGQMCPI